MSTATQLTHPHPTELAAVTTVPADRQPALVYLASLSPGSRRTLRQALDVMAQALTARL